MVTRLKREIQTFTVERGYSMTDVATKATRLCNEWLMKHPKHTIVQTLVNPLAWADEDSFGETVSRYVYIITLVTEVPA